jgi:hypothetical protein
MSAARLFRGFERQRVRIFVLMLALLGAKSGCRCWASIKACRRLSDDLPVSLVEFELSSSARLHAPPSEC